MTWRDRAACLGVDPELFFPIGNTGPALLQIEEAKAVCRRCEVVEPCLSWAVESRQEDGVWGGQSGPGSGRGLRGARHTDRMFPSTLDT